MVLNDEEHKHAQEILKVLDNAISNGRWERSLFFKAIRKQLEDLRDQFQKDVDALHASGSTLSYLPQTIPIENRVEVYVSIYAAEGSIISKWENLINSLGGTHTISRPVYRNEQDIIANIRSKDYKQNDAYIAVYVQKSDILKPYNDKPPIDRFGRELLILKEGAVDSHNITRFVHISGIYSLESGKLIRRDNTNFL